MEVTNSGVICIFLYLDDVSVNNNEIFRTIGDNMKKILVRYTAEIDNDLFDRMCKLNRIGKKDLHAILQHEAELEGRVAIRKKLQEV